MSIAFIFFGIFIFAMSFAAYKDLTTMTIPNWISLLILFTFFAFLPFAWQGWAIFGEHMLVGLCVFLFGFALFAAGWLGGGDAKMMAATSFWWQWPDLMIYVIYTAVAGGALAALILISRKIIPSYALSYPWLHKLVKIEKDMPYGVALAIGGILTLMNSKIFEFTAAFG